MKQLKTKNSFKGILADEKLVRETIESAGMQAKYTWQFGELVKMESSETTLHAEPEEPLDNSIPIINAVTIKRGEYSIA